MKKHYFTAIFVFFSLFSIAQDIDFYHKYKNDNYLIPQIDSSMSFEEFHLLSENLRMIDMVNAAIVPGYVHFKSGEKKMGYTLLGLRLASYATMSAILFNDNIDVNGFELFLKDPNGDQDLIKYKLIYFSAFTLAASTYLFDWIKGSYLLKHKQEEIRYKFALKMSLESYSSFSYSFKNQNIPTLGFRLQF